MRLLTGDECGLLKEVVVGIEGSSAPNRKNHYTGVAYLKNDLTCVTRDGVRRVDANERQSRHRAVVAMCRVGRREDGDEISFAAMRHNGSVEVWRGEKPSKGNKSRDVSYEKLYATGNIFKDGSNSSGTNKRTHGGQPTTAGDVRTSLPIGLGMFESSSRFCAVDGVGNTRVLSSNDGAVVHTFHAYQKHQKKYSDKISTVVGKRENQHQATTMAVRGDRLAIGGRERDVTVVEADGTFVWKAKNVPPNPQTLLQELVWPSAVTFFGNGDNVLAAGTAYHQLRLYDVRAQRRPVVTVDCGEYRIMSIQDIVAGTSLAVANTAGFVNRFDVRMPKWALAPSGRFVGPVGSVRGLSACGQHVAAVGLDRILRVYNAKSTRQEHAVYLTQRLNCVLFLDDVVSTNKGDNNEDDDGINELLAAGDAGESYNMDQDDLVQDYIDSDDEDRNDEDEEYGDDDDDDDEGDESGGDDGDDRGGQSDDDSQEVEALEEKHMNERPLPHDDHTDDGSSGSDINVEINEDSPDEDDISDAAADESDDDIDDEVVVIKAPKRKRRR